MTGPTQSKLLLDTHTLVWALAAPEKLGPKGIRLLPQGDVVASSASLWELVLKIGKNDALVADPLAWWARYVTGTGITVLAIRETHVIALAKLPPIHKDPFDRILVAQATCENRVLVSRDTILARYGVPVVW